MTARGDPVRARAGETADVVLADGTPVHIRPICPSDADGLRAFHARLSPQSIVLRFFGPHPRLSDAEVERFTHVDGTDRVALVAEHEAQIVAVCRYDRVPGSDEAEIAFVVDDDHQSRGLGSILLQRLAGAARSRGIGRLRADTLSENFKMLHVFRDAGFPRTFTRSSEVMGVVMDISRPAQPHQGLSDATKGPSALPGTPSPGSS